MKTSLSGLTFSEMWWLQVLVLQRTSSKFTKFYNSRAQQFYLTLPRSCFRCRKEGPIRYVLAENTMISTVSRWTVIPKSTEEISLKSSTDFLSRQTQCKPTEEFHSFLSCVWFGGQCVQKYCYVNETCKPDLSNSAFCFVDGTNQICPREIWWSKTKTNR